MERPRRLHAAADRRADDDGADRCPTSTLHAVFAATRALRIRFATRERPLDSLSMGMSSDFEAAIEEGATHVRVGSALFEGVRVVFAATRNV
jgi:hypothetical protein